MAGTSQRFDTPAARVALARRRQRAALQMRSDAIDTTNTARSRPIRVDTGVSGNNKPHVKEVISSPGRASSNPRPLSGSPSRPRPYFNRPTHPPEPISARVRGGDTTTRADYKPPVKEVIQSHAISSPNRHAAGGNQTIDGTLTTSGLTMTTTGLTASSASRSSPEKKSGRYNSQHKDARQVLERSSKVSEAANSLLNSTSASPPRRSAFRNLSPSPPRSAYRSPANASPRQSGFRTTSSSPPRSPYQVSSPVSPQAAYRGSRASPKSNKIEIERPDMEQPKYSANSSSPRKQSLKELALEHSAFQLRTPTSPFSPSRHSSFEAVPERTNSSSDRNDSKEENKNAYPSLTQRKMFLSYSKPQTKQNLNNEPSTNLDLSSQEWKSKASERGNSFDKDSRRDQLSSSKAHVDRVSKSSEDPLSVSRRRREELDVKQTMNKTGGQGKVSSPHNNAESNNVFDEGPLSARRMKMESSETTVPISRASQMSFNSSPRRNFRTRRNLAEDPLSATRRDMEDSDAPKTQANQMSQSPSRSNLGVGGNVAEDDILSARRKVQASGTQPRLDQRSGQEQKSPSNRYAAPISKQEEDPLSASRRKMEESDGNANGNASPSRLPTSRRYTSPRRQNRQLPPRGRFNQPSPPREKDPNTRQDLETPDTDFPTHRPAMSKYYSQDISRKKSPLRRKIASTWTEKNVPTNNQRKRPPPIRTVESDVDENQAHEVDTSLLRQSPSREGRVEKSTPQRSPLKTVVQATVHSPGVQQLSTFLIDSSSATEASTIGEMPHHQYSSPKLRSGDSHRSSGMKFSPHQNRANNFSPRTRNDREPHVEFVDDQGTMDEGKVQILDSACIRSGSFVTVKIYATGATIGVRKRQEDQIFQAEPTGHFLGRDEEVLKVTKAVTHAGEESDYVRYGDKIVLRSTMAYNHALGARQAATSGVGFELVFETREAGPAEEWTLLSAKKGKEVAVGRAALQSPPSGNDGRAAPVRSGDPLVLRNCQTGGILSIDENRSLVLLTDSYNSRRLRDRPSEDPSLLGRLQHHDRLMPSNNETFQLFSASTPPCPQWVSGRDTDERIFLTGSYLLRPQRNQRSAKFESTLFIGDKQSNLLSNMEGSNRRLPTSVNPSPTLKEVILVDEVIGSFLGLEGRHIRLKGKKGHSSSLDDFEFQLFDADGISFDASLRNLVDQILPLSTSFVRVHKFVSYHHPGYEYGMVMHAFCEGLDSLLQDYVTFVAQLERQHKKGGKEAEALTMKSIYFQIMPSLHSMSILEHATSSVRALKGGALINALRALDRRVYMGDVVAKKVLNILLDKAAVPYMVMLKTWLRSGVLRDPYEEFMVVQSHKCHSKAQSRAIDGDAWAELFTINEQNVIDGVLSAAWTKQKVMTTGKYWKAVQACNVDNNQQLPPSDGEEKSVLHLNSDCSATLSYLDSMYQSASRALVRLLMDSFDLMGSLHQVKRYFLLESDFAMNFLDTAELELSKECKDISVGRVQHWLSMSIQASESQREEAESLSEFRSPQRGSCKLTPHALRCQFAASSLIGGLDALYAEGGGIKDPGPHTPSRNAYGFSTQNATGIEAFSIELPRIPFPVSLVLSKQALESYTLLFRHIFFAKHVERRMIGVWRDHQSLKRLHSLRGLLGPTFLLRQRMLHFIQNLIYFMTFEVIESNWMDMQSCIDSSGDSNRSPSHKAQTVDDILDIHNKFLQRTLEACLLTNRGLVRSLTKVMNTCLMFTDQMKKFMETTRISDDSHNLALEKRRRVQQSLNDRGVSKVAVDKKALRRALAASREERQILVEKQIRRVNREVSSESYIQMIERFDEVFSSDLADFMIQLNSHTATGIMANLAIRLDYNGFVTSSIAMIR